MQKRLLQDVVSKDETARRVRSDSLHDSLPEREGATMRIPPRRKPVVRPEDHTNAHEELAKPHEHANRLPPRPPRPPFSTHEHNRGGNRNWLIAGVVFAILIVAGIGFGLSALFAGASVEAHPKQAKDVLIDGSFVAQTDPEGAELAYTTVTLERAMEESVTATRQEQVEEFASGEITIFNNFDENIQRLIRNTRFEAKDITGPDGQPLIYRVRDSVDVPGMSTNAAGESVPGTITVAVYADAPGDAYNVDQIEFSIPGFVGTSRFDGFYARTNAPIEGGFSGTRLTVEESVEQAARERLRSELQSALMSEISGGADMPEGTIFFESGAFIEYSSLPSQEVSENSLTIRERGVLTAILFNEADFASRMAGSALADYDGNPVTIQNPESLDVAIDRLESEEVEWDEDTYTVRVRGRIDILWLFDESRLRNDLLGIPNDQDALRNILFESHPGVIKAEINNRPFWRGSLPSEPERITITTVLD